jgi:sigma-E factor negative regulatory protein RseC
MSLNKWAEQSNNNKIKEAKDMIEETAIVVSASQGHAWVKTEKNSSCGSCSSGSSCSSKNNIFSLFGKETNSTQKVANPLYAKPGDKVVIGLQSGDLLKTSLLAYLLPLLTLILFAIVGKSLFAWLGYSIESGAMLFGVAGLIAGFSLADKLVKHVANKRQLEPVILRIKEDTTAQPLEFMPPMFGK